MISPQLDAQFRACILHYAQEMNWHWIPRAEMQEFAELWTEILNDADVQGFIQRTLYIPWERPVEPHGRFFVSILDHLSGKPEAASVYFNFHPDVRLTEATITGIELDDPNDGEMCVVTYTYPAPHVVKATNTVDYAYVMHGNGWRPGTIIPCKFLASHPSHHRLKELTPNQ